MKNQQNTVNKQSTVSQKNTINNNIAKTDQITEKKEYSDTNKKYLDKVYKVISDNSLSFQDKIDKILDIGMERFDISTGFMTRIGNEKQKIIEAKGSVDTIQKGKETNLNTSYCRKTIKADDPLTLNNAAKQGWNRDSAYEKFELECYIGTKIPVRNKIYGTICFAGDNPKEPFTEKEKTFIEILGRLIGYELKYKEQEKNLKVIDRVFRHNLRNSLSKASIHLDLIEDELGENKDVQKLRETIKEIEDLSKRARTINQISLSEKGISEIDIKSTINRKIKQLEEQYPQASIISFLPEDNISVYAIPEIERAIQEIIENAIIHTESPYIGISVEKKEMMIYINISDNGSGLPKKEKEMFEGKSKISSLTHSEGLGLWISKGIVKKSKGKMKVKKLEKGNKITICLQKL